ncbi:MFS general substrate transporter [Amniculicola lignicola CBS 123094]|uniref:MFS general substrate transporter n=1 Tax=Amniculicola lignicola CBS 123094 TaxID=1392246 RepID=A0A6A5WFD0_9PLEO|nr:MFS general substrate transporter [Amniculicola lignicola CBS 123094]
MSTSETASRDSDATKTMRDTTAEVKDELLKDATPNWNRSWRFWGVFVALCLLSFISALDVSIVATALPTITKEVGGEEHYIWIANCFVLASSVPQPIFGQLANIFGRRSPVLVSIILFALGSAIAGGAYNAAMLIAGRSIQGVGAGGIYVLIDIICCDLVPLRERGKYLGYLFSFAGIGAAIGPVVGGALALRNWRWIFYINIPISGLALTVVLAFLKVSDVRGPSWLRALKRVDFVGSAVFTAAMISILLALIVGGTQHPWESWNVIVPLVLGGIGWIAFHVHQSSSFCKEPIVPARIFGNRTSATALLLTFVSSLLIQIVTYFLPIYFQAVLGTSALDAGINFLPFAIISMVFAVIGGAVLSKTGIYRPVHLSGFGLLAIGLGLLSTMNDKTPKATWVGFQIIVSAGAGLVLSTILPAIMAALPESDTAVASSAYSFTRTFGQIWGVTIASIVFNATFDRNINLIGDEAVRKQLSNGAAYAYASKQYVPKLPEALRAQVIEVYIKALGTMWHVAIAFACFAFVCVFIEKDIKLRDQLETEYGLKEEKKNEDPESRVDSQFSSQIFTKNDSRSSSLVPGAPQNS